VVGAKRFAARVGTLEGSRSRSPSPAGIRPRLRWLAAGRRSAVQAIRWRCTSPRVVGGHGARNGEAVNFAGATFGVVWAAPLRHRPEPEGRLACRAERAQDGRAMPMTSEPYSK